MPDLSLLEWLLVELGLLAIALLSVRLSAWQRLARAVGQGGERISGRPAVCFALIFAAGIVLRICLLPVEPVPAPLFHDEFSYLLGADTLAHGRLTNPPPPVPIAFETEHVNVLPTYQSMYLPGPAVLLSAGKVLGSAWLAVMIATALFPALTFWAFSGWVSRGYALAGAAVAFAMAASMNWWFDNYFCLALSCIGTTLVLGSMPRILTTRGWRWAMLLGMGLLMLALTRPYEGLCVALPCVAVLVRRLWRNGFREVARLSVAPVAVLAAGFAWLLYYNWRGTGHALLFPYMLNFRVYHITGPFVFSAKRPLPLYRIDMLRRFYIFAEVRQYALVHAHPWQFLADKVAVDYANVMFGLGTLLVVGLVHVARRFPQRLYAAPLLAFAGFAVNVVLMGWSPFPQYVAPAAPVLYLLIVFGTIALRRTVWRGFDGVRFVNGLALAELMLVLSIFGYRVAAAQDFPEPQYVSKDRAHVAREVLSYPGKQLCLVRYIKYHDGWQEWVFNGADLQNERLVWARSLNPQTDAKVIAAFPDRHVWLVTPDRANQLVQPYSPSIAFSPTEYDPPSSAPGEGKH